MPSSMPSQRKMYNETHVHLMSNVEGAFHILYLYILL